FPHTLPTRWGCLCKVAVLAGLLPLLSFQFFKPFKVVLSDSALAFCCYYLHVILLCRVNLPYMAYHTTLLCRQSSLFCRTVRNDTTCRVSYHHDMQGVVSRKHNLLI